MHRLFSLHLETKTAEIALAPRTARVKQDGEVVEVAIEAIAKGDVVVIRPGDRIPVDGPVVDGAAVVNQEGNALPIW